jgi:hypothetical protein
MGGATLGLCRSTLSESARDAPWGITYANRQSTPDHRPRDTRVYAVHEVSCLHR